ncbi:MAG: oligosaccharide flippase family protein [candidate division Zixibacteria bacterium]|nr:oligosaccharide flippase family protein [candidate division Zixibacteria bacterium]
MAESVTKEARVIVRHSMVYGLSAVLDRLIGFLMLPVYTRFLTPADYGIMELIYMTMSAISLVVGFGIEAAVSRFYFDYQTERERKKVISTAIIVYGAMAFVIIVALFPLSGMMAKLILDSAAYTSYFKIAILNLAVAIILPIVFAYMRVQQKSFQYMITRVAMTVVGLSLNIYFVVIAKQGVYGILFSDFLFHLIFAVVLTLYTLWKTGLQIEYKLLKEMLIFGLPLIPSNIAAYIVVASDRYFIKQYGNISMTGLYGLGYKFGILINQFVTSPFIQIWSPRRFEYFGKEGYELIYARIFTYFCTLSLFCGLMISLLSKEIIHFMVTEPFWPAYKIVPIITLAYIVFSFHYHFNVGIMMKKATKYIAYVNAINCILNLVLNFILIKRYSIWGAAVAALICFIFKSGMTYYFSNRLYKIHMEWRRVAMLFATAFALFFAAFSIETGSIWLNLAVKGAIGLSFPCILYLVRFFTDEEIKRIKHIVKTRKLEFD